MSEFIGVVTTIGQQKIAAAIGGAALNLTTIRVGDGNGASITPAPGMTDLVRRVGAGYPIISSTRDPVNLTHWRVTTLIPVADGPFDIREIGVFDAAGVMIAIARHVLVQKRTPAQGAAIELITDIVFPVSETAQVTVEIRPTDAASILTILRNGFCVVDSAQTGAPPQNPASGATYVVPTAATGAWAGLDNRLSQWTGAAWVSIDPAQGFIVVAADRDVGHSERFLRRTAAGWTSGLATVGAVGVVRLATVAEVQAGTETSRVVTPADLAQRVATDVSTGLVRLATTAEVTDGLSTDRAVTPATLTSVVASRFLRKDQDDVVTLANSKITAQNIIIGAGAASRSRELSFQQQGDAFPRFGTHSNSGNLQTWSRDPASGAAQTLLMNLDVGGVLMLRGAFPRTRFADPTLAGQFADIAANSALEIQAFDGVAQRSVARFGYGGSFQTILRAGMQRQIATEDRAITSGLGLTGGGDLSADRTLAFDTAWGDARYLSKTGTGRVRRIIPGGSGAAMGPLNITTPGPATGIEVAAVTVSPDESTGWLLFDADVVFSGYGSGPALANIAIRIYRDGDNLLVGEELGQVDAGGGYAKITIQRRLAIASTSSQIYRLRAYNLSAGASTINVFGQPNRVFNITETST